MSESHKRIALADIDRDGDLDLVSSAGLHWNMGSPLGFVNDEDWNFATTGFGGPGPLALGDVNGDGYIDVLTMTSNYPRLVLNRGSVLGLTAVWQSTEAAHGAALVDLDGDGDLDLVCGGDQGPHLIYANEGTGAVFSNRPVWSSSAPYSHIPAFADSVPNTPRVVVGDLDLDGDLDLVFGINKRNPWAPYPNQLFLNNGSGDLAIMFPQMPDWEFVPGVTRDMALGDIDGDGDLDLMVANDAYALLYLNRHDEGAPFAASIFDTTAVWTLPRPSSVVRFDSLEMGDVDHDGDLDAVLAMFGTGTIPAEANLLLLNEGPPAFFAGTGIRLPNSGYGTTDVDLGDVDGDGDLDLITAHWPTQVTNYGIGYQVFLNISPVLSVAADEPMFVPMATRSMVAGDVDLDGDPDLITGNLGRSYLFRSDPQSGAYLPPVGETINNFDSPTRALALADFDADGYPDIALGNGGSADGIYRNVAGSFEVFPFWESAATSPTTSLAAGDLDGDGHPDLVTGNTNGPNRLYLNPGITRERFPWWEGAGDEITQAVGLADLDADGDLDAIFGNWADANTVYLNSGATLAADPVWSSRDHWNTTSVAVGDVDGDNHPDLVFGNYGQPNTLYLNSRGALAGGLNIIPWYSAESDSTTSVALVDVNGDGYLDLVCGNTGTGAVIYINSGGIFPSQASFRTERAMNTRAVALADFDGDGDIDLVCGNDGQVNTVHLGRAQPLLPRDFTRPTHHRPNNPSLLSGLRVVNAGTNRYDISVTAADVESDPVGLVARFRFRDSPRWLPVEIGLPTSSLPTSPAGETHRFQWDVSRLTFDPRDVVFQVSTIPDPQTVHEIHHTSSAQFTVGPLDILRSQLVTEPALEFRGVTVGDTVSVLLTIANTGNAELAVSAIDLPLPEPEMWLTRKPPFMVAPSATVQDTVYLAPVQVAGTLVDLVIASNAPLTPMSVIPVATDIMGLTVATVPLLAGETAPLGDALTIQVIADENVHVERGALHYRRMGSGGEFTAIELTPTSRAFIGVIPGHDVTEGGLEYYIELENSGVFATDPADTSSGRLHTVTVEDPTAIDVSARPSSGNDYLAGRAIRVDVVLPDGAEAVSGRIHYRSGGQGDFAAGPLQPDPPYLYGTIPDTVAGVRGLEYWVEIETRTRVLTDPASGPALNPHMLPVTVPNHAEPDYSPGGQFRLVSVPLQFKDDFPGTLEALLFDQPEFGSYDPLRWRSFRWLPGEARYAELSEEAQAAAFRPEPGRAFWLICRDASRITTAPITATSTPTDRPWSLELQPGWNQVGNPFAFAVAWDSVRVTGGESRDQVAEPPVAWVPGVGYQDGVPALEPWQGYWVKNIADPPRTVVLDIPPREAPAATKAVPPQDGWRVAIRASAGDAVDGSTRLGCASSSVVAWDPADRSDPPLNPRRGVSVYFPHGDWPSRPGRYTVDVREPLMERHDTAGHRWAFDVAKNFREDGPGNTVALEFAGVAAIPAGLAVSLLDRELGQVKDLRETPSYLFHLGVKEPVEDEADARFMILIGDRDFVDGQLDALTTPPLQTILHQNYPNPFNPETMIRCDVALAGHVDLRIYDLTGALVKTLQAGVLPPGGYEFVWQGHDDHGHRAASGVYFYRLTTPDAAQTKRMTLLK